MRRSVSLFTAAVAAALLAGQSARAEDLPWTFNWTPSNIPSSLKVFAPGGTSADYLQLTNEPLGKPVGNASGQSDLTMTGIKVFSAVDHAHQLDLGSTAPVKFTLRLTDKTTGVFQDF